jgi:hypothetical protein
LEIGCSGKNARDQHNGLVPHLVAKLQSLEGPHQIMALANWTTAPDTFHQSQTY